MKENDQPTIGLVAAWGRFPVLVAETLKASGYRIHCVAIKNHADTILEEICDDVLWTGPAKLGVALRWFRKRGVGQATMAGKLHKVML